MPSWTERVEQILLEERSFPTAGYEGTNDATKLALAMINPSTYPRRVQEDTRPYEFKAINYQLLSSLSAQFDEAENGALRSHLVQRIADVRAIKKTWSSAYPSWNNYTSELPLVAEFLIRSGHCADLFDSLSRAKPTPGVILLLLELRELLSLNWNLLSDSEMVLLSDKVTILKNTAHVTFAKQAQAHTSWTIEGEQISVYAVARETMNACDGVLEHCRKARFFQLKGELLRDVNLEVNQDKKIVESFLQQLGFSQTLIQSLNEADKLQHSSSLFDLKSSMGHLRSFLENMQIYASARVAKKSGGAVPKTWGEATSFLRQSSILTKPEEGLATGLYTFISDGAVHPLIAEREYARLSRNVVIEYGLLLLRKLDKFGLP